MRNSGFTLIETLVALIITVGAALIISNSWSGNNVRVRKAALYNNVASLLEKKMVEMEAKYKGKKPDEIGEESGDFGEDFPQYRWTFSAQPFEMPDMTPFLANQDNGKGAADPMMLTVLKTMQETVKKAIAEATVTVYVKGGEKEIPFSVTTYFVDYDADIIPGGGG